MYALTFLNDQDIEKLQAKFQRSLEVWMNDYSFNTEFKLEISHARFENIKTAEGSTCVSESGVPARIWENDTESNWGRFIFSNLLHLCPQDARFKALIDKLKKSFYLDVIGVGDQSKNNKDFFSSCIDAYLHLHIESAGVGVIDLYAPHAFFAQRIDKFKPSLIKLESIEKAISALKVPVRFTLEFGAIPFADILQMETGGILASNCLLDNTFSMTINDSKIAKVSMGKLNNKTAFVVKGK